MPRLQDAGAAEPSDALVVAYAIKRHTGAFEDDDPYTTHRPYRSSSAYAITSPYPADFFDGSAPAYSGGSVRWHNAVVIHGERQWPVLDARGVIRRWQAFGQPFDPAKGERPLTDLIAFVAADRDSNGDGLINDLDAERVYVYRPSAQAAAHAGPTPVSPEGVDTMLAGWRWDPASRTLFLELIEDADGDARITPDDPRQPYRLAPSDPATRPLLDEPTRRALQRTTEGSARSSP